MGSETSRKSNEKQNPPNKEDTQSQFQEGTKKVVHTTKEPSRRLRSWHRLVIRRISRERRVLGSRPLGGAAPGGRYVFCALEG